MEVEVGGNISLGSHNNGEGVTPLQIGKNIQQMDNIEQTQQPKWQRASDTIHDAMHHLLQVLNAALDGVLVLVMRLRLFVLNDVHTEQVFCLERSLQFCVVRLQSLHSPIITDGVFQGCGQLGLRGHGVAGKELRVETPVDLNETAPTMPRDPVIMSGNVGDERIG